MNLTDEQRQRVTAWILEGAKLSEVQNRLVAEFGVKLTYMEARFLVDDLKLTPKDPEPPKVVAPPVAPLAAGPAALRRLNQEFESRPLPRYAIRTLVDPSDAVWSTAKRINYDNYPLNQTVMANYELEQTIFPFEIWRLKPAAMREKASPVVTLR